MDSSSKPEKLEGDNLPQNVTSRVDLRQTFVTAFETVKQRPGATILGGLAMILPVVFTNMVLLFSQVALVAIVTWDSTQTTRTATQAIAHAFATLVVLLVQAVLSGGYYIVWLRLVRGQKSSLKHMIDVVPFTRRLVSITLALHFLIWFGLNFRFFGTQYYLFVLAGFVPGLILLLGLVLTPLIVVDKDLGIIDALRASWRIIDGYKKDILLLGIMMLALNLAGLLLCCVGLIVTVPVSVGATVGFYHQISTPDASRAPTDAK